MANQTAERVFALVEPAVKALGLTLWDVRFLKEGASWYLRVYIDKEGGVGIDDCTAVSHAIDPILDEADPIAQSYYLEVCSPGLCRELTRPAHYAAMVGRPVCLRLYQAENGCKEWRGTLLSFSDAAITLQMPAETKSFDRSSVAAVRLDDADF